MEEKEGLSMRRKQKDLRELLLGEAREEEGVAADGEAASDHKSFCCSKGTFSKLHPLCARTQSTTQVLGSVTTILRMRITFGHYTQTIHAIVSFLLPFLQFAHAEINFLAFT